MIITQKFGRTILTSEDGKVLTDNQSYGKVFVLAEGRTPDEFTEITDAEYQATIPVPEFEEE